MPNVNTPAEELRVAVAARTLALLNQQADALRSELATLKRDLEQVKRDLGETRDAQLREANEKLVLAAMRAQAIADAARRRLGDLARSRPAPSLTLVPPSGKLAQAEYQTRVGDLREANAQLLIAALSAQELEADTADAHDQQITFLAMAAHELRNPLLPLRLAAQMITRGRADDQMLAKLQETINGQVSHMARLIGDLLDGSRVSTGKFRLVRSSVDLNGILDVAIETCQPAMDAKQLRFTHVTPGGPLMVDGDPVRLVQVFTNLLENASKYTQQEGEISLEAVTLGHDAVITVSDNGIGITAEALPHVFDLFVQDAHATEHDRGGLGIGLAVVRELVQAHGGTVGALSAGKDQGSQFIVSLPLGV